VTIVADDTHCQKFELWLRLFGFRGRGSHEMFWVIVDYPPLGRSSNKREKGSLSYLVQFTSYISTWSKLQSQIVVNFTFICAENIFRKMSKSTLELGNTTNELPKLVMRP
jgi:hypothetical protein